MPKSEENRSECQTSDNTNQTSDNPSFGGAPEWSSFSGCESHILLQPSALTHKKDKCFIFFVGIVGDA